MTSTFTASAVALLLLLPQALTQTTCPTIASAGSVMMATGYESRVVMKGLSNPRGIAFDSVGNMLIVQQGRGGVVLVKLNDNGGTNVCAASQKTLINDNTLNHGIDFSADGKTLFVSSLNGVFAYPYDAAAGTVGAKKQIITNTQNGGFHLSRTLLAPKKAPGLLLVQRGSDGNLDKLTLDMASGHSQVRMFNISTMMSATAPVDYVKGSDMLAWGLRNSVGVGEDATSGGIWTVENSADDMKRGGKDVHSDNPAEEMNYHGIITDGAAPERGKNYGYPDCFSAWDPSTLGSGVKVGQQVALDGTPSNGAVTDAQCAQRSQARLVFPSHTAPLDIKFKKDGSAAYISFHGSWDRPTPDGFRLSRVEFKNGQPIAPQDSKTAAVNVMWNQQTTSCPNRCFRPVGLAFDSKDRLFMTSDSTGEVYVITGV